MSDCTETTLLKAIHEVNTNLAEKISKVSRQVTLIEGDVKVVNQKLDQTYENLEARVTKLETWGTRLAWLIISTVILGVLGAVIVFK